MAAIPQSYEGSSKPKAAQFIDYFKHLTTRKEAGYKLARMHLGYEATLHYGMEALEMNVLDGLVFGLCGVTDYAVAVSQFCGEGVYRTCGTVMGG